MNRNRKPIRLTESQLNSVIKESVKRCLYEISTDTLIAAHKKAQSELDDLNYDWDDDLDWKTDKWDKRNKLERQTDYFADYAQEKGAKYYPYGLIGWYTDDSDGVFDRSKIVLSDDIDDIPDDGYGIYALTREGRKTYEEWCEDASSGYDLCYGRMKGLAGRIGGTERKIWNYLTSDKTLSKKIRY